MKIIARVSICDIISICIIVTVNVSPIFYSVILVSVANEQLDSDMTMKILNIYIYSVMLTMMHFICDI